MARWIGALALLAVALGPGDARAQSAIERAEQLLAEADFEGAITALDRAERSTRGLTRSDVVRLYANRAVAHLALDREDEMSADLRRVAALDPRYELGDEVRPEIRDAFARIVAAQPLALALRVEAERRGEGIVITARVRGDEGSVVRTVRVSGRVAGGQASWRSEEGGPLVVTAAEDAPVEYYAEAIGPGGAVVASQGGPERPRVFGGELDDPVEGEVGPGEADDPLDDDGPDLTIVWIVSGIAAAIALGVVIALVATAESDETQPLPPMVFE